MLLVTYAACSCLFCYSQLYVGGGSRLFAEHAFLLCCKLLFYVVCIVCILRLYDTLLYHSTIYIHT